MKTRIWISTLLVAMGLFAALPGPCAQSASPAQSEGRKNGSSTSRPSAEQIKEAKAKGLVWVNTATRVYHKDGPSYGTTRLGRFMTEDSAKKAGYRIAAETGSRRAKS